MNHKRVLVTPLDWGLGHATRCIPIIDELQRRGLKVFIASSGYALVLLKKEFPEVTFFELAPYRASYSHRLPLIMSVFLQLPKFLKTIAREHRQVEKIVSLHSIDLIISDNRFGCWTEKVPSVFITHQVAIQMPWSLKWLQPFINYFNRRLIRRFTHCWIPDSAGELSLTGKLSQTKQLPVKYIGTLSRFKKSKAELQNEILVILSGPEPQRTFLEKIMLAQLKQSGIRAWVVCGVMEQNVNWRQEGEVKIVNYLPTIALEKVINQSALIIARSGYSTIMDLATLGKKAIFIPTPGQTEQEYLAERLMSKGIAFMMRQNKFNLIQAIDQSKGFKGFSNIEIENKVFNRVLSEVLEYEFLG